MRRKHVWTVGLTGAGAVAVVELVSHALIGTIESTPTHYVAPWYWSFGVLSVVPGFVLGLAAGAVAGYFFPIHGSDVENAFPRAVISSSVILTAGFVLGSAISLAMPIWITAASILVCEAIILLVWRARAKRSG